ncbi:MAG TPA: hypothetical protein V6C81_01800 [Planktothrix sp.]|jgi:hypothetical protein
MQEENKTVQNQHEQPACDNSISRKEFLASVIKRATVAGTLLAAPKIIDHFLVPAAYAASSTNHQRDTGSNDTANNDTVTNDTGSGDTGSSDTGSGDTSSSDTGSGDTGSSDTGSGDTTKHSDCTSAFHDALTNPFHDRNDGLHGTSPFHDCIEED